MALRPVRTWTDAGPRIHIVRNSSEEIIGANVTLTPEELAVLIENVQGLGVLGGSYIVLEQARRNLLVEGVEQVRIPSDRRAGR